MGFLRTIVFLVVVFGPGMAMASELPINEMPMYGGGVPELPGKIAATTSFVATMLAEHGTRENAARAKISRGWRYIALGDLPAAMRHFNQAYLLDPEQGEAYTGMAVVVMSRDQNKAESDALFRRAVLSSKHTTDIFLNYGRFLLRDKRFEEGERQLATGLSIDPDAFSLRFLRAGALAQMGMRSRASEEFRIACEASKQPRTELEEIYAEPYAETCASLN